MRRICSICVLASLVMAAAAWGPTTIRGAALVAHVTSVPARGNASAHTASHWPINAKAEGKPAGPAFLFGARAVQRGVRETGAGSAEAFRFHNQTSGIASEITVYVDVRTKATRLLATLYADKGGYLGSRLERGSSASVEPGAWNSIPIRPTPVKNGKAYWLAVVGKGGRLYVRVATGRRCLARFSRRRRLWWSSCPLSGYVSGEPTAAHGTASTPVTIGSPAPVSVGTNPGQPARPVIAGIVPNHGPVTGGTSVTITGAGFTGATAVRFGDTPAEGFSVDIDGQITATAPPGSGQVSVTVASAAGQSNAMQYAYDPPPAPPYIPDNGGRLISQGLPTYSSGGVIYPVSNMTASSYSEYRCTPSCAGIIDISSVPLGERTHDVFTWYNEDNSFDYVDDFLGGPYNLPKDFTIDVNTAAGGGSPPTSGWVTLENVTSNRFNAGQYALNLSGYNWVRMNVTASAGTAGNMDAAWHMDLTSCSSTCTTAGSPEDAWLFLGDSITNNSMTQIPTSPPNFMQQVNETYAGFYPSAVNGGMSAWLTSTLLATNPNTGQPYVKDFLQAFPAAHFVTLNLGTADVGGGVPASTVLSNIEALVQDVLDAGRIPVVPTIPWAPTSCSANLANDNPATPGTANYAIVNSLYATYPQVLHGPDLWTYFEQNPSLISTSGVPGCPHPTDPAGQNAYRALWATTMGMAVYANNPGAR